MVKVSKMMLHYTLLFSVPIAGAYYFWDPKSDDEIRKDVETKVKPDLERRRKHQAKFAELLMPKHATSEETQKQLDQVTDFTPKHPGTRN
uniref:Uncharacterized protein n=1 Tax=Globisporangium ultimum (strain ATCC 200006 / CBS 805.95 / DAOM BR144) TaxID=431595 RepID=K3WSH7_GLOUD